MQVFEYTDGRKNKFIFFPIDRKQNKVRFVCVRACVRACLLARARIKSETYTAEEPPFCADNVAVYVADYFIGVKWRCLLGCAAL
jgi:hypothetical protein